MTLNKQRKTVTEADRKSNICARNLTRKLENLNCSFFPEALLHQL